MSRKREKERGMKEREKKGERGGRGIKRRRERE